MKKKPRAYIYKALVGRNSTWDSIYKWTAIGAEDDYITMWFDTRKECEAQCRKDGYVPVRREP